MRRPWKLAVLWFAVAVMTVLLASLGHAATAIAANPTTMSFQGKVVNADGTNVADGTYPFTFKIYSAASGGTAIWGETQSSVTVTAGVFQVNLGSVCSLFTTQTCSGFSNTAINFNTSNSLYLGITFNNDPAGEMTPRPQLQSVPFAFNADTASNAISLGGLAASNYVQLSPSSQQTGAINVSGALQGGSISISGGAFAVNSAGAITASTGIATSGGYVQSGSTANTLTGATTFSASGTALTVTNTASIGTLSVGTGGITDGGNLAITGRTTVPSTTGTTGQGYFIQNSTPTPITSFQGLDLSGSSFGFFGVNKYYNGSAWVDDGLARKGSSFQVQDDSFTFYSFDTGTNFTARLAVASGGNVGVATTSPTSLFSVGTASQFQVNGSGAIVALTGITTSGGYLQSGSTANTFSGASTFSAAGTALTVTNSATIGTGLTITSGGATIGGNSSVTGNLTVNTGTANQLQVTSGSNVPTADQLNITNTGSTGVTAAGINGLSIAYKGGAAAVEAAAQRIDLQPGTTSGGTWDAIRIVPNATGAVSGVTLNGIKLDNLTTPGAGTEDALNIGTGWDNVLQSAHVVITQVGAISGVTTLTAATVNATTSYQANGTAGIAVTCTGTQYMEAAVVKEGILTGDGGCAGIGLSDERVKTDITPLSSSDALDSIKNVNPVNFYYDCSNSYFAESNTACDSTYQTGVIAQQLMQIFPNLVSQDSYGYYHVDYQGLSVENLEATREIAQYLDSAGNATLHAVTADSLDVAGNTTIHGNLTIDGTLNYASTTTANGSFTTGVITPALTSDGALAIDSGSAGDVAIDTGSAATINIGGQNAAAVSISRRGQTTTVNGALAVDEGSSFGGNVTMNFTGPNELNVSSDLAGNVNGINFVGTPSTTAGTTAGVAVTQADGSGSNGLGSALRIDNANKTLPITSAIQISNSGGGGYNNLISTDNFSVSGSGDVTTNGAFISKNGSFQLLDAGGNQVVTIDNGGNASFAGNLNLNSAALSGGLTVGGDVNVAGLSTFQKLATFLAKTVFKQDVEFQGHITVASDSAGYALLRSGESTVHVTFKTAYDNPPVVTTGTTDGQFVSDSVNNVTTTGFDISLPAAATQATTLSWTAVGVNSPQTASNPLPPTTP